MTILAPFGTLHDKSNSLTLRLMPIWLRDFFDQKWASHMAKKAPNNRVSLRINLNFIKLLVNDLIIFHFDSLNLTKILIFLTFYLFPNEKGVPDYFCTQIC